MNNCNESLSNPIHHAIKRLEDEYGMGRYGLDNAGKLKYIEKIISIMKEHNLNPNEYICTKYKIGSSFSSLWWYLSCNGSGGNHDGHGYKYIISLLDEYPLEDASLLSKSFTGHKDEYFLDLLAIFDKGLSKFESNPIKVETCNSLKYYNDILFEIIQYSNYVREMSNDYMEFVYSLIRHNKYNIDDTIKEEVLHTCNNNERYEDENYDFLYFYLSLCPDITTFTRHELYIINRIRPRVNVPLIMEEGVKRFKSYLKTHPLDKENLSPIIEQMIVNHKSSLEVFKRVKYE